ncbi:MAG: phage Gp37/Gp68 family protein [Burkholderiaceae bacterium]|jgi:protein gp37|nr:phage Gp37/Gp68 family protein [Burkholderiaceae bacterium]
MAEKTNIPWCHSTFNPWIGCTKISEACTNCYAERWGARFGIEWGPGKPRHRTSASTWKQPLRWNRQAEIKFKAWEQFKKQYPGLTDAQLQQQGFVKPVRPRVFCGSLCDVFDNEVDPRWRAGLFDLIEATPYLCWLLLTKRIGKAKDMIQTSLVGRPFGGDWPWPNVWLGATVCNQEEADRDIPKLLAVPAAKRFLSIEPILGDVCLTHCGNDYIVNALTGNTCGCASTDYPRNLPKIDWVICGSETGPRARPTHPQSVRSLRDQCVAAGVPFFFKQNGEWLAAPEIIDASGSLLFHRFDDGTWVQRVGHKAAGNLLDGRAWQEVPA